MKRKGLLIMMIIAAGMVSCKKKGCTDPTATNYSEEAKKDDGTCTYAPESGPGATNATILACSEFSATGTTYELVDLGLEVDYIVECQMAVNCDLTIKPGVTIEFKTDAGLKVNSNGSINAIATSTEAIKFSGVDKAPGAWAGIFINSDDVKNKIDKCILEYAGGESFNSNGNKGGFVLYSGTTAEISNTHISKCQNDGINAVYTGCTFDFINNTITTCGRPMQVATDYGGSIIGGDFTGNTTDVIYIYAYAGQSALLTSQTWTNLNVPYRIKSNCEIGVKTDWTIAPGTTIEFEQGSGITMNTGNSIKAVGTASERITFKGAIAGQGAWRHIEFYGTNLLNEIAFCDIIGGGEDPTNTKGSIYLWFDAKLNIHDVQFTDNAACGVFGNLFSSQSANPNYSSSNLSFTNTPCTESFE